MDLCSDGHEEICYDGRTCPMCALIEEKTDLEDKIEKLEAEK